MCTYSGILGVLAATFLNFRIVPKFGNHSNRRYADQVALRYAQLDNVSKVTIDFFFGWNLKKMKEDMMHHYAGMNRVMRLALSKVTMRM